MLSIFCKCFARAGRVEILEWLLRLSVLIFCLVKMTYLLLYLVLILCVKLLFKLLHIFFVYIYTVSELVASYMELKAKDISCFGWEVRRNRMV